MKKQEQPESRGSLILEVLALNSVFFPADSELRARTCFYKTTSAVGYLKFKLKQVILSFR